MTKFQKELVIWCVVKCLLYDSLYWLSYKYLFNNNALDNYRSSFSNDCIVQVAHGLALTILYSVEFYEGNFMFRVFFIIFLIIITLLTIKYQKYCILTHIEPNLLIIYWTQFQLILAVKRIYIMYIGKCEKSLNYPCK